jgi:hypothetical protein
MLELLEYYTPGILAAQWYDGEPGCGRVFESSGWMIDLSSSQAYNPAVT